MAKSVKDAILNEGGVKRGRLGVLIQDLTPDLASSFGFSSTDGVFIGDVLEDGPAAQAGLQPGDIIVKYDGKNVAKAYELRNAVAATAPDSTVDVSVFRKGDALDLNVQVGRLQDQAGSTALSTGDSPSAELGITVQPLTDELREQLGLEANAKGVVVTRVQPGSAAHAASIRVGDVIVSIDGQSTKTRAV